MVRRFTNAELRDRVDGLALGLFATMSAVCTALIEVHPDERGVIDRMRDEALSMLATLADLEQDIFPPEAIEHAFKAALAALVSREEEDVEEPSNDNG